MQLLVVGCIIFVHIGHEWRRQIWYRCSAQWAKGSCCRRRWTKLTSGCCVWLWLVVGDEAVVVWCRRSSSRRRIARTVGEQILMGQSSPVEWLLLCLLGIVLLLWRLSLRWLCKMLCQSRCLGRLGRQKVAGYCSWSGRPGGGNAQRQVGRLKIHLEGLKS